MKIHEYQSKELLSKYGIPVPRGQVASTPSQAEAICRDLGGKAVVKAQIYAGGRGKAGGIKVVSLPQEAYDFAASLIGSHLVTAQTGSKGAPVQKVLVEEPAQVARELYLALTIDRAFEGPVFIASAAGGMEIEEAADKEPETIAHEGVDIVVGIQPFQGRRLCHVLGLEGEEVRSAIQIMTSIYKLFMDQDCSLVEINPLVVTVDGSLVAVDAKINLEDDALFRNRELATLADPEQEDPLELEASQSSISYVKLAGTVGCLVNGAGLAMATMDLVRGVGIHPANFLDVGGSADDEKVAKAVKIMLSDLSVKSILVNIFGGILRNDVVARGIVKAYTQKDAKIPLVVRMEGTNVEEGRQILADSGLNVSFAYTLTELEEKLKPVVP